MPGPAPAIAAYAPAHGRGQARPGGVLPQSRQGTNRGAGTESGGAEGYLGAGGGLRKFILGTDTATDDVLLAPNKIFGPWSSTEEYLKTHYNLIREDAVAPLRDAVAFVREDPSIMDTKDAFIYEKVSR